MKNKFFNNAIVGNKNMVASFSNTGELLRLYYPQKDFKQFIDFFGVGMKINDSGMIYFHEDINNQYEQKYIEDTNILITNIYNSYFNIKVTQIDFVPVKENILIRRYIFKNENEKNIDIKMLIHSKLLNNSNNKVSGIYRDNNLMQYTHDYTFAILSDAKVSSFQINNVKETILSGNIGGNDYVGMSDESAISYNIGNLASKEETKIDIIIAINQNHDSNLVDKLEKAKNINVDKELDNTKKYWRKFIREHSKIDWEDESEYKNKIQKIYNRSILLFPLLTNYSTGGISAAMEIDEELTKCGRYSYCWPRDAVFITKALDKISMEKEVEKFYTNFCKNTQSKNGMWEQRFFTDGNLAPAWGYQVDETASVIYGVYQHYLHTKDVKFLKNCMKMCNKAIQYLEKYIEEVIKDENILPSYDLWENYKGIFTYSLASIFAAFNSKIEMNKYYKMELEKDTKNRIHIEQINKEQKKLEDYMLKIKEYIMRNLYDSKKKSFIRSKDGRMDISLLGLVYPFSLFTANEKKIENTVERIDMTLRTYTGGYLRYENDNYCGGNPWVIANLWMANYYLDKGNKKKAEECFKFAVNSATENGFLPEQVDNSTMKAKWVIGLGWSHAMFITTLERLIK